MLPLRVGLLVALAVVGCRSDLPSTRAVDASGQDMSDGRPRDAVETGTPEPADAATTEVADAAGSELGPGGCLWTAPPPPDDGCGDPPRLDCLRRCGSDLEVMCCRAGDRCLEYLEDGCAFIRRCTSWADGPCALHGGPAVQFCGVPVTLGYAMRWDRIIQVGTTCTSEGRTCGTLAQCTGGRWQPGS